MWHIGVDDNAGPTRHALWAGIERVLGVERADRLLTHLPQHTADEAATKNDIALLAARFDRMDGRANRMENRLYKMQRSFLTVSFGTLTVMTAIFAFITRI
jgi:hypothetical protein